MIGPLPTTVELGIGACVLAVLIVAYLLFSPGPVRLASGRRRPPEAAPKTVLTRAAGGVTGLIDALLARTDPEPHIAVLERAGLDKPLQEVVLLVGAGSLVGAAGGLVLGGPVLGLVLALAVPLVVRLVLGVLAGRRRAAFADQLDDSLQLIASSLRAGQSMRQALASVAREADQPTSEEFARIVNELRVGRPLRSALTDAAARMDSDDFTWVTQAIAINAEVGGNLAKVLDRVGDTIRERNQIRRQVAALSAEGKLSAYVLIALPFGIAAFLLVANRKYMLKFTESALGYSLIGASVLLLVLGALWLRKVVSFKF